MELVLDFSNWKLRQFRDFQKSVKDGDFDSVLNNVFGVIKSWNLKGDPKNFEWCLDNLSVEDWAEIVKQVNKSLAQKFEIKN